MIRDVLSKIIRYSLTMVGTALAAHGYEGILTAEVCSAIAVALSGFFLSVFKIPYKVEPPASSLRIVPVEVPPRSQFNS